MDWRGIIGGMPSQVQTPRNVPAILPEETDKRYQRSWHGSSSSQTSPETLGHGKIRRYTSLGVSITDLNRHSLIAQDGLEMYFFFLGYNQTWVYRPWRISVRQHVEEFVNVILTISFLFHCGLHLDKDVAAGDIPGRSVRAKHTHGLPVVLQNLSRTSRLFFRSW